MKRFKTKKGVALVAAVVAVAVAAVGAYAYFTASGSGTGSATIGHSTAFTVNGSAAGTAYPDQSQVVTIDITNNGSGNQTLSGDIYLAGVRACSGGASWTGTFAGGSCVSGTHASGCESVSPGNVANPAIPAADWYMADVSDATSYTPGPHPAADTASLVMNDFGDQTAAGCEDAGLTLFFATR